MQTSVESKATRASEIELTRRAIARTDAEIVRLETIVERLRFRQVARHCEIVRQETLALHAARKAGVIEALQEKSAHPADGKTFQQIHWPALIRHIDQIIKDHPDKVLQVRMIKLDQAQP